jgi:glucosamine-phosphate N-acetyltransferase
MKYIIRELEKNDYYLGYLSVLSELTTVNDVERGQITFEEFSNQFDKLVSQIFVILVDNIVIATGSYVIEPKFIHNLGSVAHIEDIVVSHKYRGQGYGEILVTWLVNSIKINKKVYKIILDCSDNNVAFYTKCGFKKKDVGMSLYF